MSHSLNSQILDKICNSWLFSLAVPKLLVTFAPSLGFVPAIDIVDNEALCFNLENKYLANI